MKVVGYGTMRRWQRHVAGYFGKNGTVNECVS